MKSNLKKILILGTIICSCWIGSKVRIIETVSFSMSPTFQNGDKLLVIKTKSVNRFDCVVIKQFNHLKLKRIIGIGGDTIKVINGKWLVNETDLFNENECRNRTHKYFPKYNIQNEMLIVPGEKVPIPKIIPFEYYKSLPVQEDDSLKSKYYLHRLKCIKLYPNNDYFFVLGDNFCRSTDSRHFGLVSKKLIFGKVLINLSSQHI